MPKYQALPTTPILHNDTMLDTQSLPELVHMDDSALSVMIDFTKTPPHTIHPEVTMDQAIAEMEASHTHLLLVMNKEGHFQGVLSSADVWGEKPIKLIQERRIQRDQVLVRTIMVPYTHITAINSSIVESATVGHIVKTLSEHKQQYALVVTPTADRSAQLIRGIFTLSQIRKQLHTDITI